MIDSNLCQGRKKKEASATWHESVHDAYILEEPSKLGMMYIASSGPPHHLLGLVLFSPNTVTSPRAVEVVKDLQPTSPFQRFDRRRTTASWEVLTMVMATFCSPSPCLPNEVWQSRHASKTQNQTYFGGQHA